METNKIATKQDIEEIKKFMHELIKSSLDEKVENRLLDSAQTREFLCGISEGTLKMLRDTQELTPSKIGGKYFYEMKDIMNMIKRNKGRN